MNTMRSHEWGSTLPVLEGRRIRLRALADRDVPGLFEIFGDPEAMRYWSAPPLADAAAARALLEEIRGYFSTRTLFQWGIARRDDDRLLGTTTLYHIDEQHRRGEIGFAVARTYWGHRYASEAVTTLVRFAFERLDLHRLEADPDPQNIASIRVLEKQGFKYEGLLRERYLLNGVAMDAAYYGLLRREWTSVE